MAKKNVPKKILIVEDERSLMQVLADRLALEGFNVIKAYDGQEGLDSARKEMPDLILLDLIMPVMDGMTMLEEMRKDDCCKIIPAIVLTNLIDKEQVAKALSAGSYDYLVKTDWKIEDIIIKIKVKLNLK